MENDTAVDGDATVKDVFKTSEPVRMRVISPAGETVLETVLPSVALDRVRALNVAERLSGKPSNMKYRIRRVPNRDPRIKFGLEESPLPPLAKEGTRD